MSAPSSRGGPSRGGPDRPLDTSDPWFRTVREAVAQGTVDGVRYGSAAAIAASTVRRAAAVPAPSIGGTGAVASTSRASSSSIASRSSSRPSAASVFRTLSGALVPWSSTSRSSGGVSRLAGAASCFSSGNRAAAG